MLSMPRSLAKPAWLALTVLVFLFLATVIAARADDKVVRIGFQKYGTLVLLKGKGSLEQKLKPLGYRVAWAEFPAGPQLLEALNAGAIDFGSTGEAPPIFAQAAGARLAYVAHEPLERALPPGARPRSGRPRLRGRHPCLPGPGRRPRRLRARLRRRLGDLGSLPGCG